jgi:hypothetical protein
MRRDGALYDKMARSVAPNVHGHSDVKRAVLLMLLGGMHKTTKEVGGGAVPCWAGCDARRGPQAESSTTTIHPSRGRLLPGTWPPPPLCCRMLGPA